jgi:hypothetical protein
MHELLLSGVTSTCSLGEEQPNKFKSGNDDRGENIRSHHHHTTFNTSSATRQWQRF